ncbi:DUF1566 domain-containing protein [bacterium]|nr:DUF1566 domain-containing protein [bacterium]
MKNFFMFFAVFMAMFLMLSCNGKSSLNSDLESTKNRFSDEQCSENKACDNDLICDETKNVCVKTNSNDETSENAETSPSGDSTSDSANAENSVEQCSEDKTCSGDLICDEKRNVCVKAVDSNETAYNEYSKVCESNPCKNTEYSTGLCILDGETYACECRENYTWDSVEKECTPNTKVANCTNLPFGAIWNQYNTVIQTWDGNSWQPEITAGVYDETPSQTQCRYICDTHTTWDGESCACDEGYLSGKKTCGNPCEDAPCEDVANSTKACTAKNGDEYFCECNKYFAWNGETCDPIPACNKEQLTPCNSINNLNWSTFKAYLDWSSSLSYCEELTEGGYTDWRLPSINELKTLIRNCTATMANSGLCPVKDPSCLHSACYKADSCSCEEDRNGEYSVFGDTEKFWSSSSTYEGSGVAWSVDFSTAGIYYHMKSSLFAVRCVRNQ